MAIGTPVVGQIAAGKLTRFATGSVRGSWVTAVTDARTAQSSGELQDPGSVNDATTSWVQVPEGATRVLIRARTPVGTGTITTSPVIRLVGAWGELTSGAPADGVPVMRLDTADANGTGVTLTLELAANVISDATYAYSNPTTLDGYDVKGASYVIVLVSTAAAIVTDAAVAIDLLFLN